MPTGASMLWSEIVARVQAEIDATGDKEALVHIGGGEVLPVTGFIDEFHQEETEEFDSEHESFALNVDEDD